MATQKHRGKNSLVKRLTAQVGDKGTAIGILKKRAKDRAAKRQGKSPKDFSYNPKTNTAKLKRKHNGN